MKQHEESLFLSLMKALYKMSIWIWVKNACGLDLMVSSGTLGPEHILSQAMGYDVLCLLSTSSQMPKDTTNQSVLIKLRKGYQKKCVTKLGM